MTGDSLFLDWLPQWLLDLAQKHGAVIASPNYRLMPEATTQDVYTDVEDFWSWLHSSAAANLLLQHKTELDLTRILTAGESAGGLLSIALSLSHPEQIRACTAAYPCVDLMSDHFTTAKETPLMGIFMPESAVTDHVAQIVPGAIESSAFPPVRLDLMLGAIQNGQFIELYERGTGGADRVLRYPFEKLDQKDVKIPTGGIAIIHGKQDDIVPPEGSERFVAKARGATQGRPGGDKIVLTTQEGGHGFDGMTELKEGWLLDTLKSAVDAWLE